MLCCAMLCVLRSCHAAPCHAAEDGCARRIRTRANLFRLSLCANPFPTPLPQFVKAQGLPTDISLRQAPPPASFDEASSIDEEDDLLLPSVPSTGGSALRERGLLVGFVPSFLQVGIEGWGPWVGGGGGWRAQQGQQLYLAPPKPVESVASEKCRTCGQTAPNN